jgi:signal transduction histidine kinase/HAMP domain-containing protein
MLAFYDNEGKLLYGNFREAGAGKKQEFPATWQANMSADHPLYIPRDKRGQSNGLVKMPDGSALLVSSKIVRNKFTDTGSRGTLILGQLFDSKKIQRLASISKMSLRLLDLQQLPGNDINADFYKSMNINAPYQVRIVDEQTVDGFLLLKDVRNRPAYVLVISFPRDIYHQGKATLIYYTKLLLLIGIVIVLIVLLLMDQLVLSRLKRLGNGIRKVHETANLRLHIKMNGKDEFKFLADNFNSLLDGLRSSQTQLEEQIAERITVEKEIRKSQDLYNQAELIGKLGHWEWDVGNDCLISCSEQFARIFDMNAEETITRFSSMTNELEFVHKDDRERVEKSMREAYENNEILDVEYRIISTTGNLRHAHKRSEKNQGERNSNIRSVGTLQDITRQKETQEKLEDYQVKLRSLMSELALVEETERRRIASGLHDHTIQNLGLSKFKLAVFKDTLNKDIPTDTLDEISSTIDKAIHDTRTLVFELSPPILYELGFVPAIEWLAEQFQLERGLHCKVHNDGKNKKLDDASKVMLFQIVRELLVNIVKHSQASEATITVAEIEDHIKIEVKDNGIGFDKSMLDSSTTGKQGFGLFSIRERLNNIGEELVIETTAETGTTISFSAPLILAEANST